MQPVRLRTAVEREVGLRVRRLGRRSYADACAIQDAAAALVAAGGADQLLLLEHPPVVTLGRGDCEGQLLHSGAELVRRGVALVDTDRGGGATYHGPGQLVGYPIIDIKRRHLSPRGYLRALEWAIASTLLEAGLEVFLRPGLTGVWAAQGKVAAIGIAVRGGISRHGFALNIDVDLGMFDLIVPCGLIEPVTSMWEMGWRGRRNNLIRSLTGNLQNAVTAAGGNRESAETAPPATVVASRCRLVAGREGKNEGS